MDSVALSEIRGGKSSGPVSDCCSTRGSVLVARSVEDFKGFVQDSSVMGGTERG